MSFLPLVVLALTYLCWMSFRRCHSLDLTLLSEVWSPPTVIPTKYTRTYVWHLARSSSSCSCEISPIAPISYLIFFSFPLPPSFPPSGVRDSSPPSLSRDPFPTVFSDHFQEPGLEVPSAPLMFVLSHQYRPAVFLRQESPSPFGASPILPVLSAPVDLPRTFFGFLVPEKHTRQYARFASV